MPPVKQLSESIELFYKCEQPILKIKHPAAEAAISLHGGQLIQFKPAGQEDVIWLSEKAAFNPAKAIRGGIPVCWPWFGRIAAPAHGFARTSEWSLLDHQEESEKVVIRLSLKDNESTRAVWPHAFNAILTFTISSTLSVDLTVKNTDSQPWRCSGALHTYFNLSHASDCHITGMGTKYLDSLNNSEMTSGGEQLMIDRSMDRVYLAPEKLTRIYDPELQRSINIENDGHNAVVIWNPWEDISRTMDDMPNDGYKTMVCVESTYFAGDPEAGVLLQPAETYSLSTLISVSE